MKVLVDTCVLIDVLQAREPFLECSKAVLMGCAVGNIQGMTTAKAITDIYYLMHAYSHQRDTAIDVVNSLFKILTVEDTTGKSCFEACFSPVHDYEDAVMDETAQMAGAAFIVTRNVRDFRKAKTEALTPEELVARLGLAGDGAVDSPRWPASPK